MVHNMYTTSNTNNKHYRNGITVFQGERRCNNYRGVLSNVCLLRVCLNVTLVCVCTVYVGTR